MNCRQYRAELIDLARSGARHPALDAHLAECAECSRFLEQQRALHSALASLAAETAATPVPDHLEGRVLAEFDAAAPSPPRPLRRWFPAAAAALAASLAAVWLLRAPAPAPHAAAVHRPSAPFVQVPYVVPPAPYERIAVMRMDVPVAALIAAGFEVHVPDAGGAVRADVLVGQDGRTLAIRLVPGLIPNSERRLN